MGEVMTGQSATNCLDCRDGHKPVGSLPNEPNLRGAGPGAVVDFGEGAELDLAMESSKSVVQFKPTFVALGLSQCRIRCILTFNLPSDE